MPRHPSDDESAHAFLQSDSGAITPSLSSSSSRSSSGPQSAPSPGRPKEPDDISHAWRRSLLLLATAATARCPFLLLPFPLLVLLAFVAGAVFANAATTGGGGGAAALATAFGAAVGTLLSSSSTTGAGAGRRRSSSNPGGGSHVLSPVTPLQ